MCYRGSHADENNQVFYFCTVNCPCCPVVVCPILCNAWTENKFTCVCVCVCVCVSVCPSLSVNSPTGQTPQRIFTVDSLKDADLRKDVPFGGLDDE